MGLVDRGWGVKGGEYGGGAGAEIDETWARGRLQIVEGGTMLYGAALSDGFSLTGIPPNPALRDELASLDVSALQARLLAADPDPGVDLKNPVRLIRAIEIVEAAGPPLRRLRTRSAPHWNAMRVGLSANLEGIDRRLDERSPLQVEPGLIAETQAALDAGVPPDAPVLTGIGYAEALAHIRGKLTLEELPAAMARSNRRSPRRQRPRLMLSEG